eukprot:TRINITY_DN9431_c0_g1_i1.p1 TRINITY_DN9431_c0_g1~~TRINITY_DN9431_c0_g1_i1.p1  ORF type:complete len:286 (-),score=98.42 TRINITY_DN9431_c0_g1_i1:31-888(-)
MCIRDRYMGRKALSEELAKFKSMWQISQNSGNKSGQDNSAYVVRRETISPQQTSLETQLATYRALVAEYEARLRSIQGDIGQKSATNSSLCYTGEERMFRTDTIGEEPGLPNVLKNIENEMKQAKSWNDGENMLFQTPPAQDWRRSKEGRILELEKQNDELRRLLERERKEVPVVNPGERVRVNDLEHSMLEVQEILLRAELEKKNLENQFDQLKQIKMSMDNEKVFYQRQLELKSKEISNLNQMVEELRSKYDLLSGKLLNNENTTPLVGGDWTGSRRHSNRLI